MNIVSNKPKIDEYDCLKWKTFGKKTISLAVYHYKNHAIPHPVLMIILTYERLRWMQYETALFTNDFRFILGLND